MRNLLFTIRFDGSAYHGWQVQENAVTVQQTVQDALEQILQTRDNSVGCSRTDSGVHANMYCFNMRTETPMACSRLVTALNAVLPDDIGVTDCRETDYEFHARYSCKSKEYIYKIWNSPCKNPFESKYSLQWKYPLDEKFLNSQAQCFKGTHDFKAFCASGSSVESTVRTVSSAGVTREGDMVIFRVEADGFPVLIPSVQKLTRQEGTFAMPKQLLVAVPKGAEADVELIGKALSNRFGLWHAAAAKADEKAHVTLELTKKNVPESEQACPSNRVHCRDCSMARRRLST